MPFNLVFLLRVTLVLASIAQGINAGATNYYFSVKDGDDLRPRQEATRPATPWKSLDKLNSIFSSLKPGDSVFLKRGEVFDGQIAVSASGIEGHPIVIAAYGTGEKPVINGLVKLLNWTNASGNIWETQTHTQKMINIMIINDRMSPLGRYPNADAPAKGYLKIANGQL